MKSKVLIFTAKWQYMYNYIFLNIFYNIYTILKYLHNYLLLFKQDLSV